MAYDNNLTYTGSTQDAKYIIEAALAAGVKHLEFSNKEWHIVVDWQSKDGE